MTTPKNAGNSRRNRRPSAQTLAGAKLVTPPPLADTPDLQALPVPTEIARPKRKARFSFGKLLGGSLAALITLAFGLWVDTLIADLFARSPVLGMVGTGLTALLVVAALGLILREMGALLRLSSMQNLQHKTLAAHKVGDLASARSVTTALMNLTRANPETAQARAKLTTHLDDVMDGRDHLALAETILLQPLDGQAANIIMQSAKRTSVVTAIAPRALIDIAFVIAENLRLIRRLATLYGGRPGFFGSLSLVRSVLAHLVVTGGISAGDGFLQDALGHGLAAKLSTRLGEGVINGVLTARVGRAALSVIRPMPFMATKPPSLSSIAAELAKGRRSDSETATD